MNSFNELGLSSPILKAIEQKGYKTPSAIQAKAIPVILERKDVLAAAQTGTGKTAGFSLPMLEIISKTPVEKQRKIQALVITPTRELAIQIQENIFTYSKNIKRYSTTIFGGVPAEAQIKKLQRGVDILVATPGRLMDLHQQKHIDLSYVKFLVLDEADKMLDMGFVRDIKKIISLLPEQRQNLLFSATFSPEIRTLAESFMNNPVSINVAPKNSAAETVNQTVYPVHKRRKAALLRHLIKKHNWTQVLVFSRTKHGADRLARRLDRAKIPALALHGNKSQNARVKALNAFKENTIHVMVATDIAARGIDIQELPIAINYDLPNVPADYIHRIGRTGRAGTKGQAISLVSMEDEAKQLRAIEKLMNKKIEQVILDDFDYTVVDHANTNQNAKKTAQKPQQAKAHKSQERNAKPKPAAPQPKKQPEKAPTNKKQTEKPAATKNNKPQRKKVNKTVKKEQVSAKDKKALLESGNRKNKGVSFHKASKNKKYGQKGPIGYGMYPLE